MSAPCVQRTISHSINSQLTTSVLPIRHPLADPVCNVIQLCFVPVLANATSRHYVYKVECYASCAVSHEGNREASKRTTVDLETLLRILTSVPWRFSRQ